LVADPSGPYLGWASSDASPASVAFDASGSLHPTGQAMIALWDFGDGTPVVQASAGTPVSHAYAAPGTYTVTLVVSDGEHDSPPAVTTAEIAAARAPSLTLAPACGSPGSTPSATVDGYALVPPAAGWNLADGALPGVRSAHPADDVRVRVVGPDGSSSEEMVPIDAFAASASEIELSTRFAVGIPSNAAPGTYAVSLPEEAGVAGVSATFTVPCPPLDNEPPHAAVGGPYEGSVGLPVPFDGLDSSDPEGAPLTYQWYFEDGGTATGPLPAHAFAAPGTYWVLLVVSDGELDSPTSVDTGSYTTVTITEEPPTGPCGAVPAGATYDSLACRLLAARTTTLESVGASRMRNRMVRQLDTARKRLAESRGFCSGGGNPRLAKPRLKRVRPWIDSFRRELRSVQARTLVPQAIRAALLQEATALRTHVNALSRALACPDDAQAP
ncbi:MAG: PKD domain-containing protein, partial [Thermodesulfobacteriota bacterium]